MSEPAKRPRKRREKLTPSEAISRGMAAQRELTMMDHAFSLHYEELFQAWVETRAEDVAKREEIHATVRAIAGARAALVRIINEGVLAEQAAQTEHLMRAAN